MKANVMLARMCYGGTESRYIGRWMVRVVEQAQRLESEKLLDSTFHTDIDETPTPMARNKAIMLAKEKGCDILCMVDADMEPAEDFFYHAVAHLLDNPGVIASPYVSGPPTEKVQVFRWSNKESHHAQLDVQIQNYGREESVKLRGIEPVAAIGSGLIAFNLKCLSVLTPPFFYYEYTDEYETTKASTEDIVLTRDASLAGVPVWVHWDHWSDHFKTKRCTKPEVIKLEGLFDRIQRDAGTPQDSPHANALVRVPNGAAGSNGNTAAQPAQTPTVVAGSAAPRFVQPPSPWANMAPAEKRKGTLLKDS